MDPEIEGGGTNQKLSLHNECVGWRGKILKNKISQINNCFEKSAENGC